MPCPRCPKPGERDRPPGKFIFVVGPSGVGKDTLINGARDRLSDCGLFCFTRRVITRAAGAGGEIHDAAGPAEFDAMLKAGAFCLSWSAHGQSYGIPADVKDHLRAGRYVIANGSRRMIGETRKTCPALHVIHVTASKAVLAERLLARGRETSAEIEKRLSREAPEPASGPSVSIVDNGGTREEGIRRFLSVLHRLAPKCGALRDY